MARGTMGAPRNTPGQDPGVRASGGDAGIAQHEQTRGQEAQHRKTGDSRDQDPAGRRGRARPGGVGRLIAIICGAGGQSTW